MQYKFEWNPIKAKRNLNKHGISFQEATEVFSDPLQLTLEDKKHSIGEERWITIGNTKSQRLHLVVHTYVEYFNDHIIVRIISARPATRYEQRQYKEI